jgi:hypothetical protein
MVPADPEPARFDAEFACAFSSDQIEREFSEQGHVFRTMLDVSATDILPKGDVQNPIQSIFDASAIWYRSRKLPGIACRTTEVLPRRGGDRRARASNPEVSRDPISYPPHRLTPDWLSVRLRVAGSG